jgi:hypothetical protein
VKKNVLMPLCVDVQSVPADMQKNNVSGELRTVSVIYIFFGVKFKIELAKKKGCTAAAYTDGFQPTSRRDVAQNP